MSDAYYTLHIAGLERQLKRFPVSDSMDIAAFIFFGDVELTKACAAELLKKVPEFDYIVTPEAKSIPLAYEMSRQSGKKYIVARKGVKVYMDRPEKVTVHSITTQKEQTLYLGHEDGDLLDGKRVLLLDDVISTGGSLHAMEELVKLAGGIVKTVGGGIMTLFGAGGVISSGVVALVTSLGGTLSVLGGFSLALLGEMDALKIF